MTFYTAFSVVFCLLHYCSFDMDIVIDRKQAKQENLQQIPCHIKYDGPAPVDVHFNPKPIPRSISTQPNFETYEASFRGRGLEGTKVNLPTGYTGNLLVIQPQHLLLLLLLLLFLLLQIHLWPSNTISINWSTVFILQLGYILEKTIKRCPYPTVPENNADDALQSDHQDGDDIDVKDVWSNKAQFSQFTIWDRDIAPSRSDRAIKTLDWLSVASLVSLYQQFLHLH